MMEEKIKHATLNVQFRFFRYAQRNIKQIFGINLLFGKLKNLYLRSSNAR